MNLILNFSHITPALNSNRQISLELEKTVTWTVSTEPISNMSLQQSALMETAKDKGCKASARNLQEDFSIVDQTDVGSALQSHVEENTGQEEPNHMKIYKDISVAIQQ